MFAVSLRKKKKAQMLAEKRKILNKMLLFQERKQASPSSGIGPQTNFQQEAD